MIIRFFEKGILLREVPLNNALLPLKIGRGDADIAFTDGSVSHQHALLFRKEGRFLLRDTGSSNGTFIGSKKLSAAQDTVLNPGTIFHFSTPANQAVVFKDEAPDIIEGESLARILANKTELTIGRNPENDLSLFDAQVSRVHCRVRSESGRYFVKDLGSRNGTFINGKKIGSEEEIKPGDALLVGTVKLSLDKPPRDIRREAAIKVSGLSKAFPGGKQGFYPTSLRVNSGSVVGIMGPSGCGKSTLLNVLTGNLAASGGQVLVHGLELRRHIHYLKHHMGYVPQYDIVHKELTVAEALRYTGKLRIEGISDQSLSQKSDNILERLQIAELCNQRIGSLSGGQKKRVCIALELINDPLILFLDEPTSPLDPQSAQELMIILRQLSLSGTTVVMVTHKPDDIPYLEEVVFLGKGGYPMYQGSAAAIQNWFGVKGTVDIYSVLNATDTGRFKELQQHYEAEHGVDAQQFDNAESSQALSKKHFSPLLQLRWLISRCFRIKLNDRGTLLLLLLQAPMIAGLISAVFPKITLSVLFLLAVSSIWLGVNNTGREIVSEADVYRRERMYNLGIGPYIASKLIVFTVLGFIQSLIFMLIIAIRYSDTELTLEMPGEIFGMLLFLNVGASILGLLVSSLSKNNEQVVSIIPLLLIPQILLAGVMTQVHNMFVEVVSYLTLSRWGTEALSGIQQRAFVQYQTTQAGKFQTLERMANAKDALIAQYHPNYAGKDIFGSMTGTIALDALWIGGMSVLMLCAIVWGMRAKDLR